MKIEVELHSKMSRSETLRALQIALEATSRLARRMTAAELQRVENFAAATIAAVDSERARRGLRTIEPAGDARHRRQGGAGQCPGALSAAPGFQIRAASGPPVREMSAAV